MRSSAVHASRPRGLMDLRAKRAGPEETEVDSGQFGQRLTLTTLGHCERPPTRAPLAPLARPESVDVHNAQVSSDLAALSCALLLFCTILVKLNQLSNGSPWRHLAHQKTPTDSDLARSAREALVGGRFW
ncbi:hypothetical protein TYRP_019224 [Tyrophagus putrescentiae]|nr:hypothetical protein TYRP_019224 [Tyrophagus putrescentiae]